MRDRFFICQREWVFHLWASCRRNTLKSDAEILKLIWEAEECSGRQGRGADAVSCLRVSWGIAEDASVGLVSTQDVLEGDQGQEFQMEGSICKGAETWLGVRLPVLGSRLLHWLGCGALWTWLKPPFSPLQNECGSPACPAGVDQMNQSIFVSCLSRCRWWPSNRCSSYIDCNGRGCGTKGSYLSLQRIMKQWTQEFVVIGC